MKKKWEYKTVEIKPNYKGSWSPEIETDIIDNTINRMGINGWELISIIPDILLKATYLYTFKREL